MLQGSLTAILVFFIALALVGVMLAWRRRGWLMQWLKGNFGLILLLAGVWLFLSVLDLWSYRQLLKEEPIVTVSIYKLGEQEFDLTLATADGEEQRYLIKGDQWQLDVRLIIWKGPIAALGNMPLYRLDRISGRYLSLEQERNSDRTVYELSQSSWFDLWRFIKKYGVWLDAQFGNAVYMPLENGAVYSVQLTPKGLLARPLNDVAEQALNHPW